MDLILFCVKTPTQEDLARAIRPIVGPHTIVMSLQNGIDAAERIGNVVGMEHLPRRRRPGSRPRWRRLGSSARVSQFRRIAFGELAGSLSKRMEWISEAFNGTGITVEASENIHKVLWTKLVFIAAISSLGSLTRQPLGDYRAIPPTRSLLIRIMKEVEAVAQAQHVQLDEDVIERWLEFIDNSAPQIKPSMQLDIESGHRTELKSMIGVVSRKGQELSVSHAGDRFCLSLPAADRAKGAGQAVKYL